ncbi:MAG: exodeoxyribonuclease VII small subunit [Bdellovibrionaceae bacterium]|nr:exodeoxyribonuclease VII small subunit [Pseudobdellovibrionaceae bacterium]
MDFEKKLGRLEEIVGKMEKGDLALEDSLTLFEEGVKLSRECHQKLNDAEAKVKLLVSMDQDGKATTTNFSSEET